METTKQRPRHVTHFSTKVLNFEVHDCTTPNREETGTLDLISVTNIYEGGWLTLEEAVQLAAAITAATDNMARRLAKQGAAA